MLLFFLQCNLCSLTLGRWTKHMVALGTCTRGATAEHMPFMPAAQSAHAEFEKQDGLTWSPRFKQLYFAGERLVALHGPMAAAPSVRTQPT